MEPVLPVELASIDNLDDHGLTKTCESHRTNSAFDRVINCRQACANFRSHRNLGDALLLM